MKCQANGLCRNEADPDLVAYEEFRPVRFACCRKCWEPGWDNKPKPAGGADGA